MSAPHNENEEQEQTYLGLRLAMILLVALLFVAVLIQFVSTGCLQPSLSAYYYTPVRPVFVAALAAIGAGLIIHRGATNAENVLLDFSGFLAFIVAFIPTRIGSDPCDASNVPTAEEITAAVRNNVLAILIVGVAAVLLTRFWFTGFARRRYSKEGSNSRSARWTFVVSAGALLASIAFFWISPSTFERIGHEWAAGLLFAGIIGVVVLNAMDSGRASGSGGYRAWYAAVAVGMGVVGGGFLLAGRVGFEHWLFWLESTLIAGFAVFWMVQTRELGGRVTRDAAGTSRDSEAPQPTG